MKLLAIASLLASAAATPALQARQATDPIPDNTPFGLVSIRSGSNLQYATFSAAQGGLSLLLDSQGATCQTETQSATFYLSNGALFLYTPAGVTQELYTDRSGMGQGVLQYSTTPGGYQPGRNSETKGWALDSFNDLTFNNASLLACPSDANSTTGPYSIWISTGVATPGGNLNCDGIAARAFAATTPNTCTYSFTSVTSSSTSPSNSSSTSPSNSSSTSPPVVVSNQAKSNTRNSLESLLYLAALLGSVGFLNYL